MSRVSLVVALLGLAGSGASAQEWTAHAPKPQQAMVSAVKTGVETYTGTGNDLQKGAARPTRAKEICKAVKNRRAENWVGKLKTVTTNGDGWGVVVVSITPQITVGTMPNSWADVKDKTLIDPKSSVYASAAKLKEGDIVLFSGTFAKGTADCFGEKSLTMSGAMMRPEFVLKFSSIAKFEPPPARPAT